MKLSFICLLILSSMSLLACQSNKIKDVDKTDPVIQKPIKETICKDTRPQICTQEYNPVCATRDTGIRCVTTPCPSSEQVTKSNACGACADKHVSSYVLGACNE